MPKITNYIRELTIVQDEALGVTRIRDLQVTTVAKFPDDFPSGEGQDDDDIPPGLWDRIHVPPPPQN